MRNTYQSIAALLFLLVSGLTIADESEPAQIMMFGVFHFSSPGLDTIKTKHINVLTEENQQYLEELSKRISEFKPTIVLLEYGPQYQDKIAERYDAYRKNEYEMSVNEIYQLGFRIADHAGLDTVFSFDEQEIGWDAEPLFEYMPIHDKKAQQAMDSLMAEYSEDSQNAHDTLTLAELLRRTNDPSQDRLNKYTYLITNHVGAPDNYVGADAAASWWHRNFRMYANIQQFAQPGERVLVIGGQGHTAILRDFLADDMDRVAVDVMPYL